MKKLRIIMCLGTCLLGNVHALEPEEALAPNENPHVITYTFTNNDLKNEKMNDVIQRNPFGLGNDLLKEVLSYTYAGNFNPRFRIDNFWKFVTAVSDPLDNLARVGCAVVPGFKLIFPDITENKALAASSVCGIISLVFGKICGYAHDKVLSYLNMQLTLKELEKILGSPETNVPSPEPNADMLDDNIPNPWVQPAAHTEP